MNDLELCVQVRKLDARTTLPAAVCLFYLLLFSALPALRQQLFGSVFDLYYAIRLGAFFGFVALFIVASRSFSSDLAVGQSPTYPECGDPLLIPRSFACFVVMIGHGATIVFAPANLPELARSSPLLWLLFPLPWAGVWIFFVLSGYLMGKAFFSGRRGFSQDGILSFYRSRLLRIAPLYYFAAIVVAYLNTPQIFDSSNLKYLVALLLFDYDGTQPYNVIGLLWSVSTEIQFYLLVPFLAFFLHKLFRIGNINPLAAAGAILGAGLVLRLASYRLDHGQHWITSVYTPMVANLDLFVTGMITSWIVQTKTAPKVKVVYGLLLLAALYVLCASIWSKVLSDAYGWADFARYVVPTLIGAVTALTILVLENAARFERDASWPSQAAVRSTQLLGTLTFAIYVWHVPVFEHLANLMARPFSAEGMIFALSAGVCLTIAIAWITHAAISAPFEPTQITGSKSQPAER